MPAANLKKSHSLNQQISFDEIFDVSHIPMFVLTKEREITSLNEAAASLLGDKKQNIIGKTTNILKPKIGKNTFEHSRPFSNDYLNMEGTFEDVVIGTREANCLVELNIKSTGTMIVITIRNNEHKKQMELELLSKHQELKSAYMELEKKNAEIKAQQETLVQSGKLAALGELSAGIAHEINQPLMSIRGYAQEIESALSTADFDVISVKSNLKEIITAADKMTLIIKHLRSFTRKSTADMGWVNIRQSIDESLKMLTHQFKTRGITVESDLDPNLNVYANAVQLEQVFINLATNARDAIEATKRGSGKIVIKAKEMKPFVEISWSDNGCGMSETVKSKIFNPFFTTKEVGKGMGIGLSLSYGILSKIHASMRVESQEGLGSKFIIQLPIDWRKQ